MGSKTSTTTQNTDPWGPSQPYLKDVMAKSKNLYNSRSALAPENPTLLQGYNNALDAAQFNPSTTANSQNLMNATINGDYMNNNPYLDATYNQMARKVGDSVNSNFSAAGRYGSGAHQGVLGETLGNLATNVYGDNYRTERQNQLAAGQFAPQLDSAYQGMLFNNANQIMNVGNQMQNYDQQQQLDPWNRLNMYSGIVNGYGGLGANQATTTPSGSKLGGILGGGISGAAAGATMGSVAGIPGAIIGGGLGAIGGLF